MTYTTVQIQFFYDQNSMSHDILQFMNFPRFQALKTDRRFFGSRMHFGHTECNFYGCTCESTEEMFLNIIFKSHVSYKNLKSLTFCKLMTGLFHEYNINYYLILNTS